jgi:predicted  nucleic acid-binding Zn-ribbon protein
MTFIKGISDSVSIFINPEPQTEETPQSQPQTNLGIANNVDAFEAATANNFNLLQPPQENPAISQQSLTADQAVDASSLFTYVAQAEPQPDARLYELQERLKSLRERQKEIRTEMAASKQKALELQKAAQEIRSSANDNQALSNATMATLGGLGALGLVAGISAPIIGGLFGGLGIFGGLSAADKEKMYKAAAELEKQAGEIEMQAEQSNSELCDCDNKESALREQIAEEERKLQLGLDEQNFKPSLMTVEGAFQEFHPDGIFIQDEAPSIVPSSSDIQNLTNEE